MPPCLTPVFKLYYTEEQVSFLLHDGSVMYVYLSSQNVSHNKISRRFYAIIMTYPKCDLMRNNTEQILKIDINYTKYFISRIRKNTSSKNMRFLNLNCQIKDVRR